MKKVKIEAVSGYLPKRVVKNEEIEQRIMDNMGLLKAGMLQKIFGIHERRFAAAEENVSDLATKAALPIVEKIGRENIDYLIFAAACSDLIEPATCNIVQTKLGLKCPAMDVKNACNSFVTALMTASAMIQSGMYNDILITTGEKLSDAINLDLKEPEKLAAHFAAFSFGDAGSAVLVTASEDESGLHYQNFMTSGEHWKLCTIKSGGSLYPRDVSKTFFEGQTAALKDVIIEEASDFYAESMAATGWKPEEVDWLITHQVSARTFQIVANCTGICPSKCVSIFEKAGNVAAASIPLALEKAVKEKGVKKGDKIILLGLAAGVSVSLQALIF